MPGPVQGPPSKPGTPRWIKEGQRSSAAIRAAQAQVQKDAARQPRRGRLAGEIPGPTPRYQIKAAARNRLSRS